MSVVEAQAMGKATLSRIQAHFNDANTAGHQLAQMQGDGQSEVGTEFGEVGLHTAIIIASGQLRGSACKCGLISWVRSECKHKSSTVAVK